MKKKKLYILTYDHGGYVLWKDAVKPRIEELFEWMEKYPKLRIGLDYESFTFDEFSKCDPEVVTLITKLIEKYPDRVGLGATTYGQPLSLTISEESNARQLTYAIRTNLKYFKKTPDVYAISEFALNNQTPQLIKQCGYKAAILRSHVMGYGYPRTFDSAWGNWVGKDKTSIPAVPTYDKEGRGFNCTTVDNWILSRWPQDTDISLEKFEEMFASYSPLLASRYDDLTQEVKGVTEYVETKDNYEYILLEDIPALYGEAKDILATNDNDFHIQMPWGYCGNEIFNGVRQAEVACVQAEKLNAIAVMLGAKPMTEEIDEAWKYALAAQHHDVTICGLLDLSRRFIPSSINASDYVKESALKTIKSNFKGNNKSHIAINTHSFSIDEWVKDDKGNHVHINLPAFSVSTVKNDNAQYNYTWCKENGIFETPCHTIKLTDNGICYIIDKKTGKKIVDNGDGELFSAFIDGAECVSQGIWNINITSCGATAVQTGKIGSVPYVFTMQFNGNSPRIDCRSEFEIHNQLIGRTDNCMGMQRSLTVNGHMHEGKLNLNLNLNLDKNRRMLRDLPYSISDWNGAIRTTEDYWYEKEVIILDKEVTPEESFNSSTQFSGIYWVAMRDKDHGIALMNRGSQGAFICGNRLSVPLIYSNEYLCGTKILDGIYNNEFAILTFDESTSDTDIHKNAVSYNYQPSVINVESDIEQKLTLAQFSSDNSAVILTTFYEENGSILARFCNYSDISANVTFVPAIGSLCEETDLLGNGTAEVTDGKLNFRPWEIKTVRIRL